MYYPKQIPYLLDKNFKENIDYKEYVFDELKSHVMCIWHMKSKKIKNETIYNNILPDACIDVVFDFINKTIIFAGFSKETEPFKLNREINFLGIRLKPGAFYSLFEYPADKIMDNMIKFNKIEKEIDLEKIFICDLPNSLKIIENYLLKKIKGNHNTKHIDFVDELYKNPKLQNVETLSISLGYNKRHLIRIFKTRYGLSPKVLLNILRLHLCLTLLLDDKKTLSEIAFLCGYYDQSHFIKEIKRYTGISPLKLIENYF